MWLNKKESANGQRYFKIPEILRISRLLLFTKEVEFLVWGNHEQGNPFLTLTNKTTQGTFDMSCIQIESYSS